MEGASRLTLIQPDGTPGPNLITDSEADNGETEFYQLPARKLPGSAWWHRAEALHERLDQIQGAPTAAIWSQNAESGIRLLFQMVHRPEARLYGFFTGCRTPEA